MDTQGHGVDVDEFLQSFRSLFAGSSLNSGVKRQPGVTPTMRLQILLKRTLRPTTKDFRKKLFLI